MLSLRSEERLQCRNEAAGVFAIHKRQAPAFGTGTRTSAPASGTCTAPARHLHLHFALTLAPIEFSHSITEACILCSSLMRP
jgi:hypothetical protein